MSATLSIHSAPALELKRGDVVLFGNRIREITSDPYTRCGYIVAMTKRLDDGAWGKFEFKPLSYVDHITFT